MSRKLHNDLSKRERQIMNIIYKRKSASVKEVLDNIPDPPTYSAVRSALRILVEKGFLYHKKRGNKFIFMPTISRARATRTAVKQLITTYFDDSVENAVTTILQIHKNELTADELNNLNRIIEKAEKEIGE